MSSSNKSRKHTSPVKGDERQQIVESRWPVILNLGILALSRTFCKDSGEITNWTGLGSAFIDLFNCKKGKLKLWRLKKL